VRLFRAYAPDQAQETRSDLLPENSSTYHSPARSRGLRTRGRCGATRYPSVSSLQQNDGRDKPQSRSGPDCWLQTRCFGAGLKMHLEGWSKKIPRMRRFASLRNLSKDSAVWRLNLTMKTDIDVFSRRIVPRQIASFLLERRNDSHPPAGHACLML